MITGSLGHDMVRPIIYPVLMVMVLCGADAVAEVINQTPAGFKSRNVVVVGAVPERVYAVIINEVGNWWDPEHTFSGDARNLSMENKAGGCFCERFPDGGGVQHLTIVNMVPGKMLRLRGALGPLQGAGVSGGMTWNLADTDGSTSITLEYSVGGYMEGGLQAMAAPVDFVLNTQLLRLKNYIEQGSPVPISD